MKKTGIVRTRPMTACSRTTISRPLFREDGTEGSADIVDGHPGGQLDQPFAQDRNKMGLHGAFCRGHILTEQASTSRGSLD